jgi:pilus assembly protein CpaF
VSMLGRFTTRRGPVTEVAPAPAAAELAAVPIEIASPPMAPEPDQAARANALLSEKLLDAKVRLHRRLIEEINLQALERMADEESRRHIHTLVAQYTLAERLALNAQELEDFVDEILDEMTGSVRSNRC